MLSGMVLCEVEERYGLTVLARRRPETLGLLVGGLSPWFEIRKLGV